jgi:hypothetical protein
VSWIDWPPRSGRSSDATSRAPLIPEPPSLERIGQIGAWYLEREPTWIRRHVETITLETEALARRRLTIDVVLPTEREAAIGHDPDGWVYWLPVVAIQKSPLPTNIDFRDEQENALPLLRHDESGAISVAAIETAARGLLGTDPGPLLTGVWRELILRRDPTSGFLLALADMALGQAHPNLDPSPKRVAFEEALHTLAGNTLVWLELQGRPGARRIVKFRCDVEVRRPAIRRRRPRTQNYLVALGGMSFELDVVEPGEADQPSTRRRIAGRLASTFGWTSFDLWIDYPNIRGSQSYHMQVAAPPGMETRDIAMLAELEHGEVQGGVGDQGAHLFVSGARVARLGPTKISFRGERRGLLSLYLMTCLVVTGLLWIYVAASDRAADTTNGQPEVAGAILLVVPALLTGLAIQPGEHAMAARWLFGTRLLLLGCSLCALAATGALAGVHPTCWTIPEAWRFYAIAASVQTAAIVTSWVLALSATDTLLRAIRSTRRGYVITCALLAAAVSGLLTVCLFAPGVPAELVGPALLVLGASNWYIGLLRPRVPTTAPLACVGWLAIAGAALALLGAATGVAGLLTTRDLASAWFAPAYLTWVWLGLLFAHELARLAFEDVSPSPAAPQDRPRPADQAGGVAR